MLHSGIHQRCRCLPPKEGQTRLALFLPASRVPASGIGHRVGQSMSEASRATNESLSRLGERLAVIDKAQETITTLSTQVVELQHVLANKQTRGAFGQARMEAIIRDALPASAYAFQA